MFTPTQNAELTLIEAIKKGDSELALALIEQGADLNLKDKYGYTALMHAIQKRCIESALAESALTKKGAEFNPQDGRGYTDLVLALIEKGADLNLKDTLGNTALMRAIHLNCTDIVFALIEKGADLNLQDNEGNTALMWAIRNSRTDLAIALIEKGADLNLKDSLGKPALMWAIHLNRTDLALALIEKGADLNLKDNLGKPALMWAIHFNCTDIVFALIEKDADLLNQMPDYIIGRILPVLQKARTLKEIKSLSEAGFFILACLQNKTISDKEASALIKRTARRLAPQRENKVETEIHPEQIARELITLDWTQNTQQVIQKIPTLSQDQHTFYAQHLRTLSADTFQSAAPHLLNISFELDQLKVKEKNTSQSKLVNFIKKSDGDLAYALKTINTLEFTQERRETLFFVLLSYIERAASTQIGNQSLLSQLLDNPSFRMELMAFFITYYASQNNEVAIFKRPSDSLKVCFDTLVQNHPQAPEWMKGALPENTNASEQASSALPAAAANYPFRLIETIKHGYFELAFALIEQGVDLNAQDEDDGTALMWAIQKGRTDLALALIEKGADLNLQNKKRDTALMYAIEHPCYLDLALALIKKGADLNLQDRHGYTALYRAIAYNHTEIALALIENGADLNPQDRYGYTALYRAIAYNHTEIALALIENGADLNLPRDGSNITYNSPIGAPLQAATELEKIQSPSEAGFFVLTCLQSKRLSNKEVSALIKRTVRRLDAQAKCTVEAKTPPEQIARKLITLGWIQNAPQVIEKIPTLSQNQRALYAQHLRTLSADTFQSAALDLLSISFELDQARAKEKNTIRFQLATLIKKPDSDLAYALKTINTIAFTQEQRESLFVALLSYVERAASTQIGNQSLLSQLLDNPSFRMELMAFFITYYASQNNEVAIFKRPSDSLKACFDTLVQNHPQAPEWMKVALPENTNASAQASSALPPAAPNRFVAAFARRSQQPAPKPAHLGRVGLNNKGLQADDGTFKL